MNNNQKKTLEQVLGETSWVQVLLPISLSLFVIVTVVFFSTRAAAQGNREPKRCVVTEVVVGGTRSDCGGWEAAKGEKLIMPAEVNKHLRVGDTFYFVWKQTRWVAETGTSSIIVVHTGESKTLHYNPETHEEVRAVMPDGNVMLTAKPKEE